MATSNIIASDDISLTGTGTGAWTYGSQSDVAGVIRQTGRCALGADTKLTLTIKKSEIVSLRWKISVSTVVAGAFPYFLYDSALMKSMVGYDAATVGTNYPGSGFICDIKEYTDGPRDIVLDFANASNVLVGFILHAFHGPNTQSRVGLI